MLIAFGDEVAADVIICFDGVTDFLYKLLGKLRNVGLACLLQPVQLHLLGDSELLEDIDFVLHL
jgi:hypothetical protein